jgi:hypothetical protein
MTQQYLEIRINLNNGNRLELVAETATDLNLFTNWLRDVESVESIEVRIRGGVVWSVI